MAKSKPKPKSRPGPKSKPRLKSKPEISHALWQFAKPVLAGIGSNEAEAEIKTSLKIAWVVWNAVIYADVAGDAEALNQLRASTESDPSYKAFIEYMVQRKRTLFGDDQRVIGEFELSCEDGELWLSAESHDPPAPVR